MVLSFDFMTISFRDLIWAPAIVDPLTELFPAVEEEEEVDLEDFKALDTANAVKKAVELATPGDFANSKTCDCLP